MLRITLLTLVALGGLDARSPAQLHVGLGLGKGVSLHASVGPSVHVQLSSHRHAYRPHPPRRYRYRVAAPVSRPVDLARGHYTWVTKRVWIPGWYEEVLVPAEYRTVCDPCGREIRVLVRAAHTQRVWRPGRWEQRSERVRVLH